MKNSIIALILLLALLMCMTACSGSDDPEPTPDDDSSISTPGDDITKPTPDDDTPEPTPTPPPAETETVYDKLNALADVSYRQVKLIVVTITGDVTLSASYTLTNSFVSYSVEQLNMLPSDGDLTGISPEYKTTHTGYAKIVNGKVTEMDGETVTLPSYDELKGNFSFAESNFRNVAEQGSTFTADVISPSSFYGSYVKAQDMKITVNYTESALSKIIITYKTTNSTVTTTYEFAV